MIKTAILPVDSNNNGKPAQEEAKKSVEKESNDSFEKANGHVSNEDQVIMYFKTVEFFWQALHFLLTGSKINFLR